MRHHGELTAMDEAAMIAGIEQQRRNLHNQGTTHIAKVDDKDALVSVAAFRFLTIVKDEHLEHVEQGALQGVASKRKKSKRLPGGELVDLGEGQASAFELDGGARAVPARTLVDQVAVERSTGGGGHRTSGLPVTGPRAWARPAWLRGSGPRLDPGLPSQSSKLP